MLKVEIVDVADTALWVAVYRAQETQRRDALFKDDYVSKLLGPDALPMATRTQGSRYTAWSVVMRTFIIDQFILELVTKGIDTIINLGAGLDTRPYRLQLPKDLRWIEVDFPKIIDLKEQKLNQLIPNCQLERVSLDLSREDERNQFLKDISVKSQKVLVITEGVIPYLSNHDVKSLADSLFQQKNFCYWITEYYSLEILNFLRTPKRMEQMKNAPFLFYPENWFEFFNNCGWYEESTKYLAIESQKLGRTPPTPGWIKEQDRHDAKLKIDMIKHFLGFSILSRGP